MTLLHKKINVYSHFANRNYDPDDPRPYHLLKIHKFDKKLLKEAKFVLTIHRDLRDVAASLVRRELVKNNEKDILVRLEKIVKKEQGPWSQNSMLDLAYEQIILDKVKHIRKVAAVINMPIGLKNARTIHKKVENLPIPTKKFSRTTHLHPNHITDGTWGSYKDTLSPKITKKIEEKFHDWFFAYGYL